MNKGVKKVRKSIVQRKKLRGLNTKEAYTKQITPSFLQEEEKHGYFPSFSDGPLPSKDKSSLVSGLMVKGVLAVILFLGVALLFQTNSSLLTEPREWTSTALTEEFPFARVNYWYQETFGSPLAFTPKNPVAEDNQLLALPVSGSVTESFQANGTGIMIATEEPSRVSVLREGVVIFAGNDRETNKTVVVQHPDGSKSTYGYLNSVDVHLYQFVGSNQQIGGFSPSTESQSFYFAIQKDKQYLDPVKVIQVDDQS
ncbi:peptidoglycan DD-metalloendopeptidase family protein [Virgibacillus byunsanensis]|uniref:Peptidoglycan DD-metalloendopeptidase family protein n=1 Tax=Virgibacillus byunsanensis TaxID=570945 RepID=A0ABW3LJN9_9BACI